jgi:endonuclease III
VGGRQRDAAGRDGGPSGGRDGGRDFSPAALRAAIHSLRSFYGLLPAPPDDLFQFFVWEILSEGSLPARRDLAWHALRKMPALTPDAMFRAPAKALLEAVALGGPYRDEKVERLRATVDIFKRHRERLHADAVKRAGLLGGARALQTLAHVDRAVRARAWLFAVGVLILPVDDHLSRVVNRLMGTRDTASASVARSRTRDVNRVRSAARRWLAARLPREIGAYREALVYLRHHGQHTCLAVAPHCTVCPLRVDCPSANAL